MFRKILIANRGEIACRVIATARRLGVATVAVYSEPDARARHVDLADEAWPIGGAQAHESYLAIDKILQAARRSGAQAVHPGYGFLSENAEFAECCLREGLVFIGPPAEAIRAMGSKAAAKALMERAGVPVLPGYHGEAQDMNVLLEAAERIGFPVLVKASAGGGGKGMRAAERKGALADAVAAASREGEAFFGDARVLLEKRLARPRHIEIQICADARGNIVAFLERDCSIQRRHQKIVEETPAPGMDPAQRRAMCDAAVAAARAVGYVGVGTVEFLVEDGRFYFLEMNARLQVEHPVTEMVARQDLVEWQLRVAAGEKLPLSQDELHMRGAAIEARICAEDPARGFLPSTGLIEQLREPEGDGVVRVDSGVRRGDSVTPYYDSLIAKLIVWGEDRATALSRLAAALQSYEIVGFKTNLSLLRAIAAHPAFVAGELDTDFLARHEELLRPAPLGESERMTILAAAAAARLFVLAASAKARARDLGELRSPWAEPIAWRLNGAGHLDLAFRWDEQDVNLRLRPMAVGSFRIVGEGASTLIEAREDSDGGMSLRLDGVTRKLRVVRREAGLVVILHGRNHAVDYIDPLAPPRVARADDDRLRAPLPARITRLLVKAGESVTRGAPLATLEAMKMEITLTAPRDGVIAELRHDEGDMVAQGATIVAYEES